LAILASPNAPLDASAGTPREKQRIQAAHWQRRCATSLLTLLALDPD
jgi:hypothetical protein